MALNLPRETRGVLRPFAERRNLEPTGIWWVYDDLGPVDGPYANCETAWNRVIELQPEYPEKRSGKAHVMWRH